MGRCCEFKGTEDVICRIVSEFTRIKNQVNAMESTKELGSIFLIGMMACGKSTVGRLLAAKLGWQFFDVDVEIEKRCGVSIQQIFDVEGEIGFRRRETAMMQELMGRPRVVIATGGGAPTQINNHALLQRGFVIHLTSSVDKILQRTRRNRSRPLLKTENPRERIMSLMQQRLPIYEALSDLTFETADQGIETVCQMLLENPKLQKTVALGNVQRQAESSGEK